MTNAVLYPFPSRELNEQEKSHPYTRLVSSSSVIADGPAAHPPKPETTSFRPVTVSLKIHVIRLHAYARTSLFRRGLRRRRGLDTAKTGPFRRPRLHSTVIRVRGKSEARVCVSRGRDETSVAWKTQSFKCTDYSILNIIFLISTSASDVAERVHFDCLKTDCGRATSRAASF